MNSRDGGKVTRFHYPILALILALAFYLTFLPHIGYVYPVHIDEWIHLGRAEALMRAGSLTFPDPFAGGRMTGPGANLEAGFQLFWGVFQSISGLDWFAIFRYFPSIVFMLTVLSVYVMARREGFGLEAALFSALIPTTVGVLGPAFLVPASLGLLFTPLILFLAFNFRSFQAYSLIFVFTSFLLAIHAPSAIYPVILLAPYILLNLKGNFKHSLGMASALALPFLIVFPWIFSLLLPSALGLLTQQAPSDFVLLPRLVSDYGYVPVAACLAGTFLLTVRGGKKGYGLALGLLALLLMLVSFSVFHVGIAILYERGLVFVMLMVGILAGAGLAGVRRLRMPRRIVDWAKTHVSGHSAAGIVCAAVAVLVLATTVPQRVQTPYYHMIDDKDYESFVWIKNNLNERYSKAMIDPWKATAFIAITGKDAFSRLHTTVEATDHQAYEFLRSGSADTALLKANGISIVYTRLLDISGINTELSSNNTDLMEVAKDVYVVKDAR